MSRVSLCALGLLLSLVALPATASAATWGSFSPSRMAYTTGALTGDVHFELRSYIDEHGDGLAASTGELTPEYLATVDVFYTAMLSDGTGPSAGAEGTLSATEQQALQDFVAGGGTLIVTPDGNGMGGPFAVIYDSWLQDYGVTDFVFDFGPGVGNTVVEHPITQGVGAFELDGTVTFTYPAQAQALATILDSAETLMVVLEPATGFLEGGRVLVLADHNALTDAFVANAGNEILARNIVAWAAGECGNTIMESGEECDDGNTEDGDGCSAVCGQEEDGGTGVGSGTSDGGVDDTAGGSTPGDATAGPPPASTGEDDPTSGESGADGAPADMDDGGCSCRSEGRPSSGPMALAFLLGALGLGRRRRRARAG